MQHSVMGAAHVAKIGEDGVGTRGEIPVPEEQEILRESQFLLPQEQQVAPRGRGFRLIPVRHGWDALRFGQYH